MKFMPYTRRSRFYRRGRSYRRGRLSIRSIYLNRSARAQASQIAALRNRINKVYKACKPERKVAIGSPASFDLNSGISGSSHLSLASLDIHQGDNDQTRIGNLVWRKDTYYLTFEYYNDSSTGYHDTESSGTSLRIICGQWKDQHGQSAVPVLTDLISNYSTSGSGMSISTIAPLVDGTTSYFRIAKDYKFKC